MAECMICSERLDIGSRTCHMCGTSVPETALAPSPAPPALPWSAPTPVAAPKPSAALPPGARVCPGCGQTYGPEFTDMFCPCGIELIEPPPLPAAAPKQGGSVQKPAAGTPCLVLYGANKAPLAYFALTRDATLIGRLDAVAGNFPDVDVNEYLEPATARKVSRKHALILRSRVNQSFVLRPLAGNTGTQIEADMVAPLVDHPMTPGLRMILGGAVRLKFEIA